LFLNESFRKKPDTAINEVIQSVCLHYL
jgi:hypothetical protein